MKRIPNILTLIRIFLTPLLLLFLYFDTQLTNIISAIMFTIASITDYFDGFIARKYKVESNFGKMLDHTADKLLVSSTLMMLIHLDKAPLLPSLIIMCRELLVSGLREHLGMIKITLQVSRLGKIKTTVQMVSIIVLLLGPAFFHCSYFSIIGYIGIWIASALTLITGYNYFKVTLKEFE